MVRPASPANCLIFAARHALVGRARTDDFSLFLYKLFRESGGGRSALLCQRLPAQIRSGNARNVSAHRGNRNWVQLFCAKCARSYKLVFELRYPDGRVEYELPRVGSDAAGFRVAGLLDKIGRTPYSALREHLRE